MSEVKMCTVICDDGEQKILMPNGEKIPNVITSCVIQDVEEFASGFCTVEIRLLANIHNPTDAQLRMRDRLSSVLNDKGVELSSLYLESYMKETLQAENNQP